MLATDLRTGSGRLGYPRTSPGVLLTAGGISVYFSKAWRAISAFSWYRHIRWRSEFNGRGLYRNTWWSLPRVLAGRP